MGIGLSLDQILVESDGSLFGVTVTSNEDNRKVSYGTGTLKLTKGKILLDRGLRLTQDTLSSMDGQEPVLFFSDRIGNAGKEGFGISQPFDVKQPENLHLKITPGFGSGQATVDLRVIAWTNHNFNFPVLSFSDLLVGIGPALSGNSPNAVYTFSFSRLPPGPR